MSKKNTPVEKPVAKKIERPVNPYDMPDKTKAFGSSGNVVRWIQFQLGIEVTGEYGRETVDAVKSFQKAHALNETGIVDKITRTVLADM
jgi:peptidoglycan hydrolase-like protein with peptidoglycan-binding domain